MTRDFLYSQPLWSKIHWRIKDEILPRIRDKEINMYLRTNDEISYDPILHGVHEPVVQSLLQFLSVEYGDFLLDIGANVGLTSVLAGDCFGRVDCVEPNQLLAAVLATNLALNLRRGHYHVYKVGLAARSGSAELLVPPHNYGGGFVLEGNAYDRATLAKKDNFARFDEANYLLQPVDLVDSTRWLAEMFETYRKDNLMSGVIKIDAEGFEPTIVKSILAVAPRAFRLAVIFENWAPEIDRSSYASDRHNLSFKVTQKTPAEQVGGARRVVRILHALIWGVKYRLVELSEATGSPINVVLFLDPAGGAT